MLIGNKGTTPAPVFCSQAGLLQPAAVLSSLSFPVASATVCQTSCFTCHARCTLLCAVTKRRRTPVFTTTIFAAKPAARPAVCSAACNCLAAHPIHSIALAQKRSAMNHCQPNHRAGNVPCLMTIKEIFHGNCEKTGC